MFYSAVETKLRPRIETFSNEVYKRGLHKKQVEWMRYISTRGDAPILNFQDVLLSGLARDGGLYLPESWPQFSHADIKAMRGKSYSDIAIQVMWPFVEGEIRI